MSNEVTIRDHGETISLRFGDQAREIVASSPSEAVKALARMMFEEHARAEKLEAALRKCATDECERLEWLLAFAADDETKKETS